MLVLEVDTTRMTYLRLTFRALQLACCLLTLALTAASFRTYYEGWSVQLGSPSSTFTILMAYTGLVYAALQLAAVEIFRVFPRMKTLHENVSDTLLAALLLLAGILMVSSDYIAHCDEYYGNYSGALRCGNLKAGTVFAFLSTCCFLLSLGLALVRVVDDDGASTPAPVPYSRDDAAAV